MSSPIHKFLFSPPPSPPRRSLKKGQGQETKHARASTAASAYPTTKGTGTGVGGFTTLTSLRTLFLSDNEHLVGTSTGTCTDSEHEFESEIESDSEITCSVVAISSAPSAPSALPAPAAGPTGKRIGSSTPTPLSPLPERDEPSASGSIPSVPAFESQADSYAYGNGYGDEELLRTPTPSRYHFAAPPLPRASGSHSLSHSHSHSRQRSSVSSISSATSATSATSSSSSSSLRRPSLLVHVEDVDATPRAPGRSIAPVPVPTDSHSPVRPLLAPAPRRANWRDASSRPLPRPRKLSLSLSLSPSHIPTNIPSAPLPPLAHAHVGASVFALLFLRALRAVSAVSALGRSGSGSVGVGVGVTAPVRAIARSKALIRLVLLACLVMGSFVLLGGSAPVGVATVPLAASFGAGPGAGAGVGRSVLALDADGRAYLRQDGQVASEGDEMGEGADGDVRAYEPVQMRSAAMLQRAAKPRLTHTQTRTRTRTRTQPSLPLPATHELLALQSYLLQSPHNAIPAHIDASVPLDAHLLLPYASSSSNGHGHGKSNGKRAARKAHRRGGQLRIVDAEAGTDTEAGANANADAGAAADNTDVTDATDDQADWLKELERERAEDVVLWNLAFSDATSSSGSGGSTAASAKELSDVSMALASVHGPARVPSSIDLTGRQDRAAIMAVLQRHLASVSSSSSTPLQDLASPPPPPHTIVMLGNALITGSDLISLSPDALRARLGAIGWAESAEEAAQRKRRGFKRIVQAKWAKGEKRTDKKAKARKRVDAEHVLEVDAVVDADLEEEVRRVLEGAGVREA